MSKSAACREENHRADELSNFAMDGRGWDGALGWDEEQLLTEVAQGALWVPPPGWDDTTEV